MGNQCRTFAGGVTTDNLLSTASLTGVAVLSVAFWLNLATIDATSRRPYSYSNPDYILIDNTGANPFNFNANFSTTGGNWKISAPSTGVWIHYAIAYDGSNVTNGPVIWQNSVSQSVTTVTAPVGTVTLGTSAIVLGNRPTNDRAINGSEFEFTRWHNYLLTQADVTAMFNGTPACAIAPKFQVWNAPLDRGENPEPSFGTAGGTFTVTGTTVGTGPPNLKARCRLFVPTHPLIGTAVGGPFFANPIG